MAAGSFAVVTGQSQGLPTTSFANLDMGNIDTDADNILTESSNGNYRPDSEGYYLVMATSEFVSTHNNRLNIRHKIQKNSTDVSGAWGSGYSRNNSNEVSYHNAQMVAYFNGTTDEFEVQHQRDTGAGTNAGSYGWTRIEVIQLSAGDTDSLPYAHYGTPTSAAFGGNTPSVATGWDVITENDTAVIELDADTETIQLKDADRPYLVVYGMTNSDAGSNRTGRLFHVYDQTNAQPIYHSYTHEYQRNSTCQHAIPSGMALVKDSTQVDIDIRGQGYLNNKATLWGTWDNGSWALSSASGAAGVMVIALPEGADVAIFEDATANQTINGSGNVDINAFNTEVEAGTVFTRDSATDVTVDSDTVALGYFGIMGERTASSGTRSNLSVRWEVEGVDIDDPATDYLRGEQGAQDHKNSVYNNGRVLDLTANDTVQVEKNVQLSQNSGANDVTSYAGAFFVDLSTIEASAGPTTEAVTKSLTYNVNRKADYLVDNFDDNSLNAQWSSFGTVSETNGQIESSLDGAATGYHGIFSGQYYTLEDSAFSVEVVDAGNQSWASIEVGIFGILDTDNRVFMFIANGTLYATKRVATVQTNVGSIAYNSTTMQYLRLREASGTMYWEYSADGQSYTTLASESDPFTLTDLRMEISAGNWGTETGTSTVIYDNINISYDSMTKGLAYNVELTDSITKSLQYNVVSSVAWYDNDWGYRVKITVDADEVPATVTDFPVFVNLADLPSGFHTNVRTDGGDIRVTEDDGETELARELVFYDDGDDEGELHFKAPSLSSSVDTDFYIYYGASAETDYAIDATYGAENVWTEDYVAVWHAENDGTDSTSNDNDLTAVAQATTGTGSSGNPYKTHLTFDGTGDYYSIGSLSGKTTDQNITLSTWYYLRSLTGDGALFSIEDTTNDMIWWYNEVGTTNSETVSFNSGNTSTGSNRIDAVTDSVVTEWAMQHGRRSGTERKAYRNGSPDGTSTGDTSNIPAGSSTRVGGWATTSNMDLDGAISGMRVADVARTDGWIEAEYNNSVAPNTFYGVGTEEAPSGASTSSVERSLKYTVKTDSFVTKSLQYVATREEYSYEDSITLDTDDSKLANTYTSTDYDDVDDDDNDYKDLAAGSYAVELFYYHHTNSVDTIALSWKGKTSLAPSSSTVYLQIYNQDTPAWETVDSDNTTGADTEFTLSGDITASVADYYNVNDRVSYRVYQEIT